MNAPTRRIPGGFTLTEARELTLAAQTPGERDERAA